MPVSKDELPVSKDELIKLAREAEVYYRRNLEEDYIKTIPDDKIVSWYEQTNDAFTRDFPSDTIREIWKKNKPNLSLPMSSKDTFDAFDTLGDMIEFLDVEIDDLYLELFAFNRHQKLNNIISTDIRIKHDKNIEERIKALESALGTKTEHTMSDAARNMFTGGKRRLTRKRKN